MNKIILLICTVALFSCGGNSNNKSAHTSAKGSDSTLGSSVNSSATASSQLALVPWPSQIVDRKSALKIERELSVHIDSTATTANLAALGLLTELNIKSVDSAVVSLSLSLIDQPALGAEGYSLVIGNNIQISAQTDAGLFYGIQTLKQLLPAGAQTSYELPQVEITDVPQYAWRGSMIDVGRHFFSLDYLKKHVERMAAFKLNKLHLHLSDDQGWRMEIKKYPKLTS